MVSFIPAIAAALVASTVVAQPLDHAHHVHKRAEEYVTVKETLYVTADGAVATNVASAAGSIVTASVDSAVAANSAYTAPSDDQTPATSVAVSYVSSAAASAASSAASAASSSTSSSGSVGAGGALGVSYSPYTSSGGCKSASEVASDLAKLTGFSVIRIYGVDCDQVANVYSALADGQKLFLGIYDVANIASGLATIKAGINDDWDCVHTVSIGNELVNGGSATVSQVVGYTSTARGILRGYGYTGPVVAVDTFIAVINNPGLCEASDYMAVNAHAYFDGGVTSSQAGTWAVEQIQRVWTACGGSKSVLISESGWPSQGDSNGVATASSSDQAAAISALKSSVGSDVILYTAFNDLWKSPGYLNIEQYFGFL